MSDSVQAHRRQPSRLLCPYDSPGKSTGVGCHFLQTPKSLFYHAAFVHSTTFWQNPPRLFPKMVEALLLLLLSRFSRVWLGGTPEMAAHQAPPSLGFSRQEHWSGLPFPSPMHASEKWKWSCSVVSTSSWPHGLQPTGLLCPWDFPGKSTGVGCHCR